MKNKINNTPTEVTEAPCNCRIPDSCLLNGHCNAKAIIYEAEVNRTDLDNHTNIIEKYVGMTERNFKLR